MAKPLHFVTLRTSLKGLMVRALREFNRYLDSSASDYRWVCVSDPELIARALEILSNDLPEEDIAQVVTRMPYLMLLFNRHERPVTIPVEPTLAFLSVLNRAEMVTILRQCSDRGRLATLFEVDSEVWSPVFFLLGGVPDMDLPFEREATEECSFFLSSRD